MIKHTSIYVRTLCVLIGWVVFVLSMDKISYQPISKAGVDQYAFFGIAFIAITLIMWGMFNFPDAKAQFLQQRLADVSPTALACFLGIGYLAKFGALHYLWAGAILSIIAVVTVSLKRLHKQITTDGA